MKPDEYRKERRVVRFTKAEDQRLADWAAKAEMTKTDYIRTRALDQSLSPKAVRAPSVERALLADTLGELGGIGAVLSEIQIEILAGDLPFASKIDTALSRITSASEAVIRALGVEP